MKKSNWQLLSNARSSNRFCNFSNFLLFCLTFSTAKRTRPSTYAPLVTCSPVIQADFKVTSDSRRSPQKTKTRATAKKPASNHEMEHSANGKPPPPSSSPPPCHHRWPHQVQPHILTMSFRLCYAMLCNAMRCHALLCGFANQNNSRMPAGGCDSQPSASTTVGRQQSCSCHNEKVSFRNWKNGKMKEKTANNNKHNKWRTNCLLHRNLDVCKQQLSAHALVCHTPSLLPLYANVFAVVSDFHSFVILWLGVSWKTIIFCLPSAQICG